MLLALYPHPLNNRRMIGSDHIRTEPATAIEEYSDMFGNRCARIEAPLGATTLWSDCIVEDTGAPDEFNWDARQHEIVDLPVETLMYLTASRYCESDELVNRAWDLFGATTPGWARVKEIANWVHNHVMFGYQFGRATKTAVDVLREGTGVCRDFSHLFIALCRAMNIPARYASGYLSDIGAKPEGAGDFCAWSEVFLEGRWYVFDARYNTPRIGRILMVRGCDAADVAMITAFGNYALTHLKVWTDEVDGSLSEDERADALQNRPATEALVLDQSSGRLRR
jgi:transglutaminase-like putative cysteine protease